MLPFPPWLTPSLNHIKEPCSIVVFVSGHKETWDVTPTSTKNPLEPRFNVSRYGRFDHPDKMMADFRARFGPIKHTTYGRLAWTN